MESGLYALGTAYTLTSVAAAFAWRSTRRTAAARSRGAAARAARAYSAFWAIAIVLCAGQAIEAFLLATRAAPGPAMRDFAVARAMLTSAALATLGSFIVYLVWGASLPTWATAATGGTVWAGMMLAIANVPADAFANATTLDILLRKSTPVTSGSAGALVLALGLLAAVLLGATMWRAGKGAPRRRGLLVAGALASAALSPFAGALVGQGVGIGLAGVAVLAAYARRPPRADAPRAAWSD